MDTNRVNNDPAPIAAPTPRQRFVDAGQLKQAGFLAYCLLCGFPALQLTGFDLGFGFPMTYRLALMICVGGGAAAGVLACPKPWIAGLVGGAIAGLSSLGLLCLYTFFRHSVFLIELAVIQLVAILPGLGACALVAKLFRRGKPS